MQTVSMGSVPEHKRRESEELAALVAQFNAQTGTSVGAAGPVLAGLPQPDKLPPPIGPHLATVNDERSVVRELRAIRAEAERLLASLPEQGQALFE